MRPITGMGNDRKAEASMFNACPLLPKGSMEIDALFNLSTGREPLPIWLRHGTMVTPKAVPNTARMAPLSASRSARFLPPAWQATGSEPAQQADPDPVSSKTALRAAMVTLSAASPSLWDFLNSCNQILRPTIRPACGPPEVYHPKM